MTTVKRVLCALLVGVAVGVLPVDAQTATATLTGVVVDGTGALVPDVHVTVLNRETGWQRETTTSGEGAFVVPLLPPGRYVLRAQRDGFTPLEVPTVVLNVNDQVALTLRLKVAGVGETLQVTAATPSVNSSAAVGTVVDRQMVENLPMNGRTFQTLLALTPGIVFTRSTFGTGDFSVNGQRPSSNYFTVDGVSANVGADNRGNGISVGGGGATAGFGAFGSTANLVSVDALEEFRVTTSTFAPEYGVRLAAR